MGMDTFSVQDLIEEQGICENSVNLVLDLMQEAQGSYVNPLKIPRSLPLYGGNMMGMMPPQGHSVHHQSAMPGQFGAI